MKKSEQLFSTQWNYLLQSNENMFDIDHTLEGNVQNGLTYNFNDYEKCLAFDKHHPKDNSLIGGEYVLAVYKSETSSKMLYSGICLPSSGPSEALDVITDYSLRRFDKVLVTTFHQDGNRKLHTGDYFAIAFFVFWTLIVIASTLYDYVKVVKKKPSNKWLTIFSLYSNIKRIFKKKLEISKNVYCLHAIRTLSILWLIISDRFKTVYTFAFNNEIRYEEWIKNGFSTFITASDVAYDSMFIVSGFLLASYCFEAFKRKRMNYLSLLLHRYIRYGPLLLISVIYNLTLLEHTISGPLMHIITQRVKSCEENWIVTLSMLENFMSPNKMCVHHGWYFSMDFQFFIIMPLFIYICHKSRKVGIIILGILIAIPHFIMFGVLIYSNITYDVFNRFSIYDMHSYFRCAPWFLSIVLASFCMEDETAVKKKYRTLSAIGVTVVFSTIIVYVYLLQNKDILGNNLTASAIFASIHRILWSAGICWIIFCCYQLENDSCIKRILNSSKWQPIAKISLTLQIVYPVYQNSMVYNMKIPYHFDSWEIFHAGLGDILICLLISVILNASVVMPFMLVEQLATDKKSTNRIRASRKFEMELVKNDVMVPQTSTELSSK